MTCRPRAETLASTPMIHRKSSLLTAILVGTAVAVCHPPSLFAQTATVAPAAAVSSETFDCDLGSRQVSGAAYSVKATQPVDSKLKSQRVRFTAVVPHAGGSTTRYFTVNTGKYKTVAQLNATLREAFAKYLGGAPANTEVGKVGDIKYGGEIRFVVESPDVLLYNTTTPGEPNASMKLSKEEVTAYVSILGGEPAAKR